MPRITTETFGLDFPDGWVVETLGDPARLNGPGGATATITSHRVEAQDELDAALGQLEDQLIAAMLEEVQGVGSLEALGELERAGNFTEPAGTWIELRARSTDGGRLFWQFGRVEGIGGMLVTVEAPEYARDAVQSAREVAMMASCVTERPDPPSKSWLGKLFGRG